MITSLSNRDHYTSLENAIYLNQASLGLIGQPAVDAMQHFLEAVARHGNLCMTDEEEVAFFSELRLEAASILNCSKHQVSIMASAGEMLSQLPYLFEPKSGSTILALSSEFPAITRPWIAYGEKHGYDLLFVEEEEEREITDQLLENITENTSVVLVSFVQFSTGSKADIFRLREASRQVGARLVVDVTQAAGAIPVNVREWRADAVVCSGYKWLGGHGGVALAVLSDEFLRQTPPAPGWMGAPNPFDFDATKLDLANDARRYTQSTMSYVSLKCLTIAIRELLELGVDAIEAHSRKLARILLEGLEGSGWQIFGPKDKALAATNIMTLTRPGEQVDEAVSSLQEAGIICGSRNGRVRISLAHYNDETDIRALVEVLHRTGRKSLC